MKFVLWYLGLAVTTGTIAAVVYHYFGGEAASFVVIVPLALIINGWVATWEDEQPGGFNNPLPPKNTKPSDDNRAV